MEKENEIPASQKMFSFPLEKNMWIQVAAAAQFRVMVGKKEMPAMNENEKEPKYEFWSSFY